MTDLEIHDLCIQIAITADGSAADPEWWRCQCDRVLAALVRDRVALAAEKAKRREIGEAARQLAEDASTYLAYKPPDTEGERDVASSLVDKMNEVENLLAAEPAATETKEAPLVEAAGEPEEERENHSNPFANMIISAQNAWRRGDCDDLGD